MIYTRYIYGLTDRRWTYKVGIPLLILILSFSLTSCKKSFLDVVPDNVATLDNAFENRVEAEKYLGTCYSWLPLTALSGSLFYFGADDIWSYEFNNTHPGSWQIAKGLQNIDNVYANYWSGHQNNSFDRNYYQAIRDCNIFLENVRDNDRIIVNLEPEDRKRWIGEVEFLKAFYHFWLMRMYGPIVIVKKNLPISVSPEDAKQERQPVDEVVDYIVSLLDDASEKLPSVISRQASEFGRVTSTAAKFLKAKVLVYAASPLFNGNSDVGDFVNKEGTPLINPEFQQEKWERAVKATKEAVDAAESAGFQLYQFKEPVSFDLSDTTRIQLSIRGSFSAANDRQTGTIWNLSGRDSRNDHGDGIQNENIPQNIDIDPSITDVYLGSYCSATLKMAELFYSKHGVPIEEDKAYNYTDRYKLREGTSKESYNIQEGYITATLNFDRENRFYADLGFDGGAFYLQSAGSDDNVYYLHGKLGQPQGKTKDEFYNVTGYWIKKYINWKYTTTQDGGHQIERYTWPLFKLNDLYLLYAEALNEVGNKDMAIEYLDKIRERAGLEGVKASWTQFSNKPDKFSTKDGLREIIHRERYIELAFEGQRIWDMRRWKEASTLMNEPVQGWDILQDDASLYYRVKTIFSQTFISPRDYFWPIKESDLIENTNLVQSPGW